MLSVEMLEGELSCKHSCSQSCPEKMKHFSGGADGERSVHDPPPLFSSKLISTACPLYARSHVLTVPIWSCEFMFHFVALNASWVKLCTKGWLDVSSREKFPRETEIGDTEG